MVTGPCCHTSTYVDGLPPVLRRTDILFSGRPSVSGPHMLAWRGKHRSGGGVSLAGSAMRRKWDARSSAELPGHGTWDRSNSMSPEPFRQGQSDRTLAASGPSWTSVRRAGVGNRSTSSCRPVAQRPPKSMLSLRTSGSGWGWGVRRGPRPRPWDREVSPVYVDGSHGRLSRQVDHA